MFERFTDRARRVLVLAQEEARLLDHNFIGTEHILMGLIHEQEGVAARALASLDIHLDAVRAKVDEMVGQVPGSWSTGSPPFTPRAKKVLEYSLREALQIGHNYIGTEHLLLGIVREGQGVAAEVLVGLGVPLDRVRHEVLQLLSGYQPPGGSRSVPAGTVYRRTGGWRRSAGQRPIRLRTRPPALVQVDGEIDLVYRDDRLAGTVAGESVDLALSLYGERGAQGTFAGVTVSATWRSAANDEWQPDVPSALHGRFADAPIRMLAWFHLEPGFDFDYGTVEGELAGAAVSVDFEAIDRDGDTGSFAAHGGFAGAGFSVRGFAATGHGAWVEGAVDGRPLRIEVEDQVEGDQIEGERRARRLRGAYAGPAPLVALLCGALLFFT
jgi:hypothetical protein